LLDGTDKKARHNGGLAWMLSPFFYHKITWVPREGSFWRENYHLPRLSGRREKPDTFTGLAGQTLKGARRRRKMEFELAEKRFSFQRYQWGETPQEVFDNSLNALIRFIEDSIQEARDILYHMSDEEITGKLLEIDKNPIFDKKESLSLKCEVFEYFALLAYEGFYFVKYQIIGLREIFFTDFHHILARISIAEKCLSSSKFANESSFKGRKFGDAADALSRNYNQYKKLVDEYNNVIPHALKGFKQDENLITGRYSKKTRLKNLQNVVDEIVSKNPNIGWRKVLRKIEKEYPFQILEDHLGHKTIQDESGAGISFNTFPHYVERSKEKLL
jgi:hypothetical protein